MSLFGNNSSYTSANGPVAAPGVYQNLPDLPGPAYEHLRAELQRRAAAGDHAGYMRLLDTAFDCLNNAQLNGLRPDEGVSFNG